MKNIEQHLRILARDYGIDFSLAGGVQGYIQPEFANDFELASDAQPTLITSSNAGIPAYLANWLDPKIITVLVAPMKVEKILGAQKKGDWTTKTAQFPLAESVGEATSYGDYNENGNAATNINWEPRQSYHFQTMSRWGEHELAMAGLGKIDYASRINVAGALVLNKMANKIGFFGVSGLQNYGLLNDPALIAPIAPLATGTGSGTLWSTKDAAAIYGDIVALYGQAVSQLNGLLEADAKMKLCMSPGSEVNLTKTNQYNVNVYDQLKKNYPNLTVESAPEYATGGGNLVQLIVEEVGEANEDVADYCFTEKMRAHAVVTESSSWKQKKSAGSWGSIIYQPTGIAQMLGV